MQTEKKVFYYAQSFINCVIYCCYILTVGSAGNFERKIGLIFRVFSRKFGNFMKILKYFPEKLFKYYMILWKLPHFPKKSYFNALFNKINKKSFLHFSKIHFILQ